ncbi:hypothetical protein ABEB36_012238 [Hypothenemus hampei]|uniref:Uncharacterized protein n=1 Tax=Hypothenemus hampei TaxID=57062 RepID=A0ABD1EAK4_HYPHA
MLLLVSTFLILISLSLRGFAKEKILIESFLKEDQTTFLWNILKYDLDENLDNELQIYNMLDKDIFKASKLQCQILKDSEDTSRLVAVLSPNSLEASLILQSISTYLNVSYIITSWRPKSLLPSNVFNLYPDADLLSIALARIVKSFDWSAGFVILYEDDASLLLFQEVLKLQEFKEGMKENHVTMHKLEIGGDNRHILKSVRSISNRIILDCHSSRIIEYFKQAQEVDLLSDFSRSFFLTSLDAHTLNFGELKASVNITTIRLFDPTSASFQNIVSEYFPGVPAGQIKVEEALMFDALNLIVASINQLRDQGVKFSGKALDCQNDSPYEDDLGFLKAMKKVKLEDTLTGPIALHNGKRDNFVLEVIETDMPEKPIAVWQSEFPDEIHLTRNATEREAELQRRMANYNFIVTSRTGEPYLVEHQPEAYKNNRYRGYSMDLITEIAKLINITFEFRLTQDNTLDNLINDLVEQRADLGICDFTITPLRREKIDFSMPFMNLGIGILHKETNRQEVDNLYAFMRPISSRVWFYLWILSTVTSITMFFVARLAPREWESPKPWDPETKEHENIWNLKNFFWLSVGSITAQGCDILPKSVSTRVIVASWWFLSLIITNSYTATLAAFLTAQKRDVTIDSVQELAAQSRVKYGLMAKGSTEQFFSNSTNPFYQKMWNTMKNEKPSVFEKDNNAGVERVISTKDGLYAFFMESTGMEYQMERECGLRKIGGLLDSKSYGIGMPLNADYRHKINSAVLKLQESGKLMQLKDKWWKKEQIGNPCKRNAEEQSTALALSNIGGVFIVLAVGVGLAYIIAIFEFLWHVQKLSLEEHLTYMETIKCELKFACKIFTKKKRAKPLPSEPSSSSRSSNSPPSELKSMFSKSMSLMNFQKEQESK